MTGLASLVRVHRWMLDEKRRSLVEIEKFVDQLKRDLVELEENLEAERTAASESYEGTVAYPRFLAVAMERRKNLQRTLAKLEDDIEAARAEVNEAFRELKKYETAQVNQGLRERAARAKRERLALDELGTDRYRRRRAADADADAAD